MALFSYTLITPDASLLYEGTAEDSDGARREAVGFLADMLRDNALGGGMGCQLTVEARGAGGQLVCTATAEVSPETQHQSGCV